jgi:hypothetical protein
VNGALEGENCGPNGSFHLFCLLCGPTPIEAELSLIRLPQNSDHPSFGSGVEKTVRSWSRGQA